MWKILIVEDDPEMREFMSDVVDMLGYSVCTADSGGQAVREADRLRPDLVVQDIMLPDFDGWTAARRMRDLPGRRDLPVVFCSGSQQEADHYMQCPPPVSRFLLKPFDIDALNAAIKEFLAETRRDDNREPQPALPPPVPES